MTEEKLFHFRCRRSVSSRDVKKIISTNVSPFQKTKSFRFSENLYVTYGDVTLSLIASNKKKVVFEEAENVQLPNNLSEEVCTVVEPQIESDIQTIEGVKDISDSCISTEIQDRLPARKKKKFSFQHLFQESVRFAVVTGVTFVIVLIGMNFSAYYQLANYWVTKIKGETSLESKNLESLLGNKIPDGQSGQSIIPYLPTAGGIPQVTIPVSPPDNRIVIPKIGKNVPIVEIPDTNLVQEKWKELEKDIQEGLRNGVVHYPGTAIPGQKGNFFVTGHSSYYFWEKSKYKDVFALLPEIQVGDQIFVFYNQKKYGYTIVEKKVVPPTNTDVLQQTNDMRITLMTCYPIGTDLNRMILVGEPINTD